MGARLENGVYKDREGFVTDFRLMIQNCKTYNSPDTFAHSEAVELEAFFDKGASITLFVVAVSYCLSRSLDEGGCDY